MRQDNWLVVQENVIEQYDEINQIIGLFKITDFLVSENEHSYVSWASWARGLLPITDTKYHAIKGHILVQFPCAGFIIQAFNIF